MDPLKLVQADRHSSQVTGHHILVPTDASFACSRKASTQASSCASAAPHMKDGAKSSSPAPVRFLSHQNRRQAGRDGAGWGTAAEWSLTQAAIQPLRVHQHRYRARRERSWGASLRERAGDTAATSEYECKRKLSQRGEAPVTQPAHLLHGHS